MREEPVQVMSRQTGATAQALLLHCLDCDGVVFGAFEVGPSKALHLQCVGCGECYCRHGGECSRVTDAGQAAAQTG